MNTWTRITLLLIPPALSACVVNSGDPTYVRNTTLGQDLSDPRVALARCHHRLGVSASEGRAAAQR